MVGILLRFFLYCQCRARLLQTHKPSNDENRLLVETNICRNINSQILVALFNNIQQCKPISVTSQFQATSGDKLEQSIYNDNAVFPRDVITVWWSNHKHNFIQTRTIWFCICILLQLNLPTQTWLQQICYNAKVYEVPVQILYPLHSHIGDYGVMVRFRFRVKLVRVSVRVKIDVRIRINIRILPVPCIRCRRCVRFDGVN